jgi:hypothetical protein
MKLIDVRHDDIPDNNNPYNKISIPIGDRLINDVLNGGYNVKGKTNNKDVSNYIILYI